MDHYWNRTNYYGVESKQKNFLRSKIVAQRSPWSTRWYFISSLKKMCIHISCSVGLLSLTKRKHTQEGSRKTRKLRVFFVGISRRITVETYRTPFSRTLLVGGTIRYPAEPSTFPADLRNINIKYTCFPGTWIHTWIIVETLSRYAFLVSNKN